MPSLRRSTILSKTKQHLPSTPPHRRKKQLRPQRVNKHQQRVQTIQRPKKLPSPKNRKESKPSTSPLTRPKATSLRLKRCSQIRPPLRHQQISKQSSAKQYLPKEYTKVNTRKRDKTTTRLKKQWSLLRTTRQKASIILPRTNM